MSDPCTRGLPACAGLRQAGHDFPVSQRLASFCHFIENDPLGLRQTGHTFRVLQRQQNYVIANSRRMPEMWQSPSVTTKM
jgi:hypothetical protein